MTLIRFLAAFGLSISTFGFIYWVFPSPVQPDLIFLCFVGSALYALSQEA